MVKHTLPVALIALGLGLAGCVMKPTEITRLTPNREFRNNTGLYPLEAAVASKQQTLRWDSIKASVVVGSEVYPMRMTSLMTNRWETLVPIPPSTSTVSYRFQFDYLYNAFGSPPRADTLVSPQYKLQIVEKP